MARHSGGLSREEKETLHTAILQKRLPQLVPALAYPLEKVQSHEKRRRISLVDEDELVFTRHAEATWLELFFDLYFVANLTTFTATQEIDDRDALGAYIGFFAVLWFTWLQVALFDLRFGKDSAFQRTCKCLQVAIPVGFAAINSEFYPTEPEKHYKAFRELSVLLMVSRIIISLQYFSIFWQVREFKKTKKPLLLLVFVFTISAALFGLMVYLIQPHHRKHIYILWYFILVAETIVVLAISFFWRILSFQTTHLIQRMGLLTLIIIGEGIIGLCETVNAIIRGYGWTSTSTIHGVSAALAIYLLFSIYFDDEPKYEYSTFSQQLWAILHFPFHLSVVLYVEGMKNMILWHNIIEALRDFKTLVKKRLANVPIDDGAQAAEVLKDVTETYFPEKEGEQGEAKAFEQEPSYLFNLNGMARSNDPNYIEAQLRELVELTTIAIFSGYGVEPPKDFKTLESGDTQYFEEFTNVYELVFVYYYFAAAVMLVVLAIFTYLIERKKDKYDWLHIAYRGILATLLSMLCLIFWKGDKADKFITSWVPVPLMVILMFFFFAIDRFTVFMSIRWSHGKAHHWRYKDVPQSDPRVEAGRWRGAKWMAADVEHSLSHNYMRRFAGHDKRAKKLDPKMPAPLRPVYIHKNDRFNGQLPRDESPHGGVFERQNDQVPFTDTGARLEDYDSPTLDRGRPRLRDDELGRQREEQTHGGLRPNEPAMKVKDPSVPDIRVNEREVSEVDSHQSGPEIYL